MRRKAKPDLFVAGPCGESRRSCGWFFLSSLRRPVNHIVIRLRDKLASYAMSRPWSRRLSLAIDGLTILAEALAEKSGVRA